jgi:hypothetical protein
VERRKPITEEDVLLTELLIARSFENLKQSAVRTTSRSLRSAGGSIKQHPYAVAGAAVGAGIILYGIFRLMNRNGSAKKSNAVDREYSSRSGVTIDLLSLMMPIVKPYITTYLENYMGRMFSRGRH